MATFDNGESGSSIRTKIKNVLQHLDGSAGEVVVNDAGADVDFRVESDTNANALFVDGATGNVGIGTSSPGAKLTISSYGANGINLAADAGNSLVSSRLMLSNGTAGQSIVLYNNSGGVSFSTGGTPNVGSGTERMRITSAGDVGIGTSAPAAKLEVALGAEGEYMRVGGDDASNGRALRFTSSSVGALHTINASSVNGVIALATANTERARIDASGNLLVGKTATGYSVNGAEVTSTGRLYLPAGSASAPSLTFSGDTNTGIGFGGADILYFTTGGTERARIDASGNVGINVTDPIYSLEVQGEAGIELYNATGGGNVLNFHPSLGDANKYNLSISSYDHSGGGVGPADGLSINGFDGVSIATGSSTVRQERMRIDSSGNVGIGTSSPAELIHIAGGGNAAYLKATNSAGTQGIEIGVSSTGDGVVNVQDAKPLRLFTTDTERMRIDSSGNVLVGKTVNDSATVGSVILSGGGGIFTRSAGAVLDINRTTSDGTIVNFRKDNTTVGSISVTASATAYNTSSDYRLKEDVQPMVGASERLLALKPVNFAWKADGSRTDGFLAHEAQEVAPYAVTGEKDGEEMQAIDHSKLIPLLTAALQDALKRIEALEAQLNPQP